MLRNNILCKSISLIVGLLILNNVNAIDPYDSPFGNEYTLECSQMVEKELNALLQRNTQQIEDVYNGIINRFENFTIIEKAKYFQKYNSLRKKKIRDLSAEDREVAKSYSKSTVVNLRSYKTLDLLFSEASDYCSSLFKEEKGKRNKVEISPNDRTNTILPYN